MTSAGATTACFDPAVQIWCADSEKGAREGEYVLTAIGNVKRDKILADNSKASRVLCLMLMKVEHDHAMSVCGDLLTCMHACKTPGAMRWSRAHNYVSQVLLRGKLVVNLVIEGGVNTQLRSGVIAATMGYHIVEGATFGSPVYRPIDMQKLGWLPHFDRGCLDWVRNGMSEGRTGTVLFDLDKLQMMNPTDSFESKKGAGLVKPHLTSIEGRVEFTTTTAGLVNLNVGAQLVAEGLPPVGAQTAACKSQCDVVTSSVHPKVLPSRTGGAPIPHNPPPLKPTVCVLSDSDIQRRLLEFIQQRTVHDLTFKSCSIECV